MIWRVMIGVVLVFITSKGSGQELEQTVHGTVRDAITFVPVSNVSILISKAANEFGTTTDEEGKFRIPDVPLGRYRLSATHVGYKPYLVRDILLESGKEFFIRIDLLPSPVVLSGVEIRPDTESEIQNSSSYPFTMEMAERIPATFYDPARITTSFPGVTTQNDQANTLSIRGNTPNNIAWRIEGLNFVNPNHLTNAGTFSDRPSVSGGGVAILSAQLLSRSRLLTGAFPASYSNALSGIFDISLREGNKNRHEYTLQAGVLGIEAAAEGPFLEDKDHSWLVNYRYSTIGILSGLGIDLGEESITFQDLSFINSFDLEKAGKIEVFGLGGLSTEKFSAERDSTRWETFEDRFDTRFDSDMGGMGLKHYLTIDKQSSLTTGVAWSVISSSRTSEYINDDYFTQTFEYDDYTTGMLSMNLDYRRNLNGTILSVGSYFDNQRFDIHSSTRPLQSDSVQVNISGNRNYWIHQPYISMRGYLHPKLSYSLGLNFILHSLRNRSGLGPRVSIEYLPAERQKIRLQYGLIHATQIPQVYFVYADPIDAYPNISLGLSSSHQVVVGYDLDLTDHLGLILEGYYQYHFKVPVSPDTGSAYSIVNAQDAFIDEILINEGKARNAGIELSLNHSMNMGYYFYFNGSLYDSRYAALDGTWRNTRYNGQYALSLTGGKEFKKLFKRKHRIIGVNGRLLFRGGFWQTPIDEELSRISGEAIYIENDAFSKKLEDYFRLDAGVYFKKHKNRYTRTLIIGIQNLTNRKNIAWQYFDLEKNRISNYYQLGIIPNISYRVEF